VASTPSEAKQERSDEEILAEAHSRFKLAEEAESEIRARASEELKFRTGDQWDEKVKASRQRDYRPCLTINKLPQHVQQVTNDQRQNRPSIKVHPVDDGADVETAKVITGLIRHIEKNSSADFAYDTAFEGTVGEGLGYFRLLTEYADPLSFDQEIKIKRIRDRFTVLFDPHSQEPDGSDANFAFIYEDISRDEFKTRYPKAKLNATGEWDMGVASAPAWIQDKSARITEYLYKEFKDIEISLLSDGTVVPTAELPKPLPQGLTVAATRKASIPSIKWCKLNGTEILEKTELPGYYIPIIPVYGTEHVIDGKRVLKGITRDAMDSQRVYNVMKSAEMEAIGLAPKAPFVAAKGQIEGFRNDWATANSRNHSVLEYNPVSVGGQPMPAPQRMAVEPAVMAITQAAMGAADDIKSTTGIHDASLGGRSNETSGVAIQRRNQQAQTSNFHFVDNLTRSMKHAGRILVQWIPAIYDTERTARIIGEDGEQRVVKLNAAFEENGKNVIYRMDTGRYDVSMDVGPSYATKRQEAAMFMQEMVKAYPPTMQIAGDLVVKNMDVPGAQELAERIKKTIDPKLLDDKAAKQEIPPQVQAQIQQMNQLIEQLTGKLNEAQDAADTKRVELESKERIEMAKLETQATIELAKLESKESLNLLAHQIAELDQRTQMLGFNEQFELSDMNQSGAPVGSMQPMQRMNKPQSMQDMQSVQDMEAMEPMMGGEMGMSQDPTGGESPGLPMEENP